MKTIKLNKPDLFCIIYDNNVRFEHEGFLIGELLDNGRFNWYGQKVKQSLKNECKNFINGILNKTLTVI